MENASGTWTAKSTGINFSNDYLMYAAMASNDVDTIYLGGHDNALGVPLVFQSTNGGSNWSKNSTPPIMQTSSPDGKVLEAIKTGAGVKPVSALL